MAEFQTLLKQFNNVIWSVPMLLLLMGTHLFLTIRLKFIQKKILPAIKLSFKNEDGGDGDVSSFATLATTLAATLGTGNIVAVSTAIAIGGPGSVFWCWITGVLGMATTYSECYLGFHYRKKTPEGSYIGGPMYVIERGLHNKPLAVIFAISTILASFGVGCSTQARAITETAENLWGLNKYVVGMIVALITGCVIIGGVKQISSICTKLVPAMGALYILGCFIILCMNINFLIPAVKLIISSAFRPSSMAGGVISGTFLMAARQGISKGLFTNEAGLGSAGIAAATSMAKTPEHQALVSMTATFWDTVVMCLVTGLVIVSSIIKDPTCIIGYSFTDYTTASFHSIPIIGETILGVSIICFAIATLIGWSYFGEKAMEYIIGRKGIKTYHLFYILAIFFGSIMSLELIWDLTDTFNAFMALPNIFTLLFLYKKVKY